MHCHEQSMIRETGKNWQMWNRTKDVLYTCPLTLPCAGVRNDNIRKLQSLLWSALQSWTIIFHVIGNVPYMLMQTLKPYGYKRDSHSYVMPVSRKGMLHSKSCWWYSKNQKKYFFFQPKVWVFTLGYHFGKFANFLITSDRPICSYRWAATWQNKQNDCASSEESDQPGHPPSLIRVFAVRMKLATHWAHSEDSDQTRQMSRLNWVFAGHTGHFVGFVMSRLRLISRK